MAALLFAFEKEVARAKVAAQDTFSRVGKSAIEQIASNPLIYLSWLAIICVLEGQDLVARVPRMIEQRVLPVLEESVDPWLPGHAMAVARLPTHLASALLVLLCLVANERKYRDLRLKAERLFRPASGPPQDRAQDRLKTILLWRGSLCRSPSPGAPPWALWGRSAAEVRQPPRPPRSSSAGR